MLPTLLNGVLLFGLFAVIIPPLIHLLNRKRFDVVDWAAMQFLQVSDRTRRKVFLEELLLMLLRMGLIALLVFALATPIYRSSWFVKLGKRTNRDVVLVFDGSLSMGYARDGRSAQDAAREWASRFLEELAPGDRVAVLQAKQQPMLVLDSPSADIDRVRSAVEGLSKPRGGVNWPASVQKAAEILASSKAAQREVILLTDGQRYGWADARAQERWELYAKGGTLPTALPRIWAVNVVPDRAADPPNWSLAPIEASRAVAAVGREVKFRTELRQSGGSGDRPPRIRIEVDGRPAGEMVPIGRATASAPGGVGRIPQTFTHRFTTPGPHLVSLSIDDPKDAMPGDNRQDYAIEVVPALPVLVVDGGFAPGKEGDVHFLRDALAPSLDTNPAFLVRLMAPADFSAEALARPVGKEPGSTPRVLVLKDVPNLKAEQQQAVSRFLENGGGVLVALGPRSEAAFYNDQLYRKGQGWLPAKLGEPVGSESDIKRAATPVSASFEHPMMRLFKEDATGGLASAYFPKHWQLQTEPNTPGVAIAILSDRNPLFVERGYGKGRVILSAVPLDNSWRTNLTDLGDFVRLSHELMYYLAGARGAERNLEAKQPIVFKPADGEQPNPVTLDPPEGPPRKLPVKAWPLTFDETYEPGVYKLTTEAGKVDYYVVRNDPGESDLTPADDADRSKIADLFPTLKDGEQDVPALTYQKDVGEVVAVLNRPDEMLDFWPFVMFGVIAMLCGEIWMTRRAATRAQET